MNKYYKKFLKRQYKEKVERGLIRVREHSPAATRGREFAYKRWAKLNPLEAAIHEHFLRKQLKELCQESPLFTLMRDLKGKNSAIVTNFSWDKAVYP